jgi:hypothetical protein
MENVEKQSKYECGILMRAFQDGGGGGRLACFVVRFNITVFAAWALL